MNMVIDLIRHKSIVRYEAARDKSQLSGGCNRIKVRLSLLARTLAPILYTMLQRLIGLNSVIREGLAILGIRTIKV